MNPGNFRHELPDLYVGQGFSLAAPIMHTRGCNLQLPAYHEPNEGDYSKIRRYYQREKSCTFSADLLKLSTAYCRKFRVKSEIKGEIGQLRSEVGQLNQRIDTVIQMLVNISPKN